MIGLGMRVGYPVAGAAVPWLATRFGWRAVPYALGLPMAAFSVIWHLFATELPAPDPATVLKALKAEQEAEPAAAAAAAAAAAGQKAAAGGEKAPEKAMEWEIFRVPAVAACVAAHVASNNLLYCFLQVRASSRESEREGERVQL
eukprot:SAG22_NODE_3043_length_1995_cov_1.829114_2_plen_145_part_00